MLKKITFTTIIFITITGCSDPGNVDPAAPGPVQMVQKIAGSDLLEDERGIDAEYNPVSENNDILLMWYRHPEESKLAYFKIYRSSDPDGLINFNLLSTTENQVNELDTVFVDTQDLDTDTRYYYYVTAVSEQDAESTPSDTVFYTLIPKAENLTLNNNASQITIPEMNFRWSRNMSAREYILRIERVISASFTPLVFTTTIVDYNEPINYFMSGDSLKTRFLNGTYRWRVDCVGVDLYTGSEAEGPEFTVNWSN